MKKQKLHNKGFSLIELLIAMAVFSIVMLMVVEFMAITSGAYRKTKKNLNVQTEALQVMEQMSDTLMQAAYIRVSSSDDKLYEIEYDTSASKHKRTITTTSETMPYDLVPDNYVNYLRTGDSYNLDQDAILNMATYDIVDIKGKVYPYYNTADPSKTLLRDNSFDDSRTDAELDKLVKSYRRLSSDPAKQLYLKPDLIYMEYLKPSEDPADPDAMMIHVLYKIVPYGSEGLSKVYMKRYESARSTTDEGFKYAVEQLNAEITAKKAGLLTSNLEDFYLTADVEGNALLTNAMFSDKKDGGFDYNATENINFRNSNVLTARPQRLYKLK